MFKKTETVVTTVDTVAEAFTLAWEEVINTIWDLDVIDKVVKEFLR